MSSNAVLLYVGAAVGVHEVWMPSGSVLLMFDASHGWYCKAAYCAAIQEQRDFLYVISTPKNSADAFGLNIRGWKSFREFANPVAATDEYLKRGLPFYGPSHKAYMAQHDVGRVVGLQAVDGLLEALQRVAAARTVVGLPGSGPSLAGAYRKWAEGVDEEKVLVDACAGAAVQVFE